MGGGSESDGCGVTIAQQAAVGTRSDGSVSFPGSLATRLLAEILDLDLADPVLEARSTHAAEIGEVLGEGSEGILGVGHHDAGIEWVLDPTRLGFLECLEDPLPLSHDRGPFGGALVGKAQVRGLEELDAFTVQRAVDLTRGVGNDRSEQAAEQVGQHEDRALAGPSP